MSKYLLLRSNKQSGPYTVEEIREMALKAYDLVWVEGKSAAWRYPGEIEELKSFAPLVEEQPFDRFFKKPIQEDQSANKIGESSSESEKKRYGPPTMAEPLPASQLNKAAVYINLPAAELNAKKEKDQQEQVERKAPVLDRPAIRETSTKEPTLKTFARSIPASVSDPIELEENYSQSLDDIKKQYTERILQKKENGSLRKVGIVKPILIGFGMVIIMAAGIFIGLSINKRGINYSQTDQQKEQTVASEQQNLYPVKKIPAKTLLVDPLQNKNDENKQYGDAILQHDDATKEALAIEKKKARLARQKALDSIRAMKVIPANPDTNAFSTHKEPLRTTESPADKDVIKYNIEDYVSLSASKYSVGTFGGISELQLTVSNTSPYALDLVVVEVQYVQSNKKTFKTENIYFRNVNPGSALTQEAPKSPRGIKVKYKVTMINSKEHGIAYSDI